MARTMWTDELVTKEALKYTGRRKFKKGNPSAYNACLRKGILDEVCSHMETPFKWTDELLREEALKYNSRGEFTTRNGSAYNACLRKGILAEVCSHMETPIRWTDEMLREEALKYNTRGEFKSNSTAYSTCIHRGILYEVCSHMETPFSKWTDEMLREEALKYNSRSEFKVKSRAFNACYNRGILDDMCSHMDVLRTPWTDEMLREEALKYNSRSEFKVKSNAYFACVNRGILDEVCSHMIPKTGGYAGVQYYLDNPEKGGAQGIYYGLLFTNKEDDSLKFVKMGITARTVKERYKGYKDWTYEIITEYQTTNLNTAYIERNFLHQFKNDYDYRLPSEMSFGGETELFTLDIIPILEEFNKNTAISEQYN